MFSFLVNCSKCTKFRMKSLDTALEHLYIIWVTIICKIIFFIIREVHVVERLRTWKAKAILNRTCLSLSVVFLITNSIRDRHTVLKEVCPIPSSSFEIKTESTILIKLRESRLCGRGKSDVKAAYIMHFTCVKWLRISEVFVTFL